MARSDRRWQGYHLTRPAAFWLSDGTLEVRIQVQINNQVFSLLTRAASRLWPRSPSLHALTSKSERKQSSRSPEDNRREEARPLSLSPSLSTFPHLFLSPVFSSTGCDTTSPWSPLSHTALHILLLLSALFLTLQVFSLPGKQQSQQAGLWTKTSQQSKRWNESLLVKMMTIKRGQKNTDK